MALCQRFFVFSQNVLTLIVAAKNVNFKLYLLEFLERFQPHLMAGVLVTLTDQSNVFRSLLTHLCSAIAEKPALSGSRWIPDIQGRL